MLKQTFQKNTQPQFIKKINLKVLKETFRKMFVITLNKYLTSNSPPSNLNVRNWEKHRQLRITKKQITCKMSCKRKTK